MNALGAAGMLSACLVLSVSGAQSAPEPAKVKTSAEASTTASTKAPTNAPSKASTKAAAKTSARKSGSQNITGKSPYHGQRISEKARDFYPGAWGIDHLRVSRTSSGNLIRFSFRVIDAKLAKVFSDHEATPYLFAPRTNAMLQVPTMDKVGQLRQFSANDKDKDYWMVFSNKGDLVKPGERVNVIVGRFHADGLLVE